MNPDVTSMETTESERRRSIAELLALGVLRMQRNILRDRQGMPTPVELIPPTNPIASVPTPPQPSTPTVSSAVTTRAPAQ